MANSISSANSLVSSSPLPANSSSAGATSRASDFSGLANEQTFLKLFVAQLKNQNPLDDKTTDPTAMVSELAQFSQLEQTMNIGTNVSSISSYLTSSNNASAATTPTSSTSGS